MDIAEIKKAVKRAMRGHPLSSSIANISLFGSRLDGSAGKKSDVDLLVKFRVTPTLFDLVDLQDALTKYLGRTAHVSTPGSLSKYIRRDVLRSAKKLYER